MNNPEVILKQEQILYNKNKKVKQYEQIQAGVRKNLIYLKI